LKTERDALSGWRSVLNGDAPKSAGCEPWRFSLRALFGLLIVFVACFPASAQVAAPSSVDIYPNGATMSFVLPSGEAEIIVPPAVDGESVDFLPGPGVRIVSVVKEKVYLGDWIPDGLLPLKRELDECRAEIDAMESTIAALKQSILHLENVSLQAESDDLARLLSTLEERRKALELEMRRKAHELEAKVAHLNFLQEEWNSRAPADKSGIRIVVVSEGEGNVTVRAQVRGASWTPAYKVAGDLNSGRLTISLQAEVAQKCGVPWGGELALHTVKPAESVVIPELTPLVVDFKPPVKIFRSLEAGMAKDSAQFAKEVLETKADIVYLVHGNVNGDGTPSYLPLDEMTLKAKMKVVCVPDFDAAAWMIAETEPLDRPLIPGEAQNYIDGTPSGKIKLAAVNRGEPVTIPLGRVPLVSATKERLIPKGDEKWWGKGWLEEGYEIRVNNGLSSEVEITLTDRVPVSAHDDIKVEIKEISPKPAEQTDRGIITWKLRLASGQAQAIKLRYRITYPADKEISISEYR
jgi:hypothetical protein